MKKRKAESLQTGGTMTMRDIVNIALRILGVVAFMYMILHIPSIGMAIGMLFQPSSKEYPSYFTYWYFVVATIAPLLLLIMAYILLKWGDRIAARIVPEDQELTPIDAKEWQKSVFVLALRIIGVICLVRGIPEAIEGLGQIAFRWGWYGMSNYWTGFVSAIVLIILGLYLLSGGKYLVSYVFREQMAKPIDE